MRNLDTLNELAEEAEALCNRIERLYWNYRPGLTQRLYNRWQRRAEQLEEYMQDQRFEADVDRIYDGDMP